MSQTGFAPESLHHATLIGARRITPEGSREDVRHLVFHSDELDFDARIGQCVRILAPGQFGSKHHPRMYLIADPVVERDGGKEFAICVKRQSYNDEISGERYSGVASGYLCDLKIGTQITFVGPVGYPFAIPDDPKADLLMIGMGTGIAPFRALVRKIYTERGNWEGKVRMFYGAKTGLEMLYMNDANADIAEFVDQPTFKAIQAISPRPYFDEPVALDQALMRHAAEVWEMLNGANTHVYVTGAHEMLPRVDAALATAAGSEKTWQAKKDDLLASSRWYEVLY